MQPPCWLAPLTVGWQITGGQSGTVEQEPWAFWTLLKLAVHSLVAGLCCGLARMSLSSLLKAVGMGTGLSDSDMLLRVRVGGGSGWDGKECFLVTHCSGNFCNLCIVFTSENYSLRTAVSRALCVCYMPVEGWHPVSAVFHGKGLLAAG